ncbi:MAG: hypothetical protein ACRD1J_07115, partial [Terriglobia bacterium]
TLEQAGERGQLRVYGEIVDRIRRRFRVDWEREQRITESLARPAWQVWCYKWKAVGGVKTNPTSVGSSGSSENNPRSPIWIRANARGRALKFVFGRRRRRRLSPRAMPFWSLAELYALLEKQIRSCWTERPVPAKSGSICLSP